MRQPSITLRYPKITDEQIAAAARARGESKYKSACRALAVGANLLSDTKSDLNNEARETGDASLVDINHQIHQLIRLTDRVLFVTCAAYITAQRTAARYNPHTVKAQQELTDEVVAAYRRQLRLAETEQS